MTFQPYSEDFINYIWLVTYWRWYFQSADKTNTVGQNVDADADLQRLLYEIFNININ